MKAITIYKIIFTLIICGNSYSAELADITKLVDSGQAEKRSEAVGFLREMINDKNLSGEMRSAAVSLAASKRVHECSDVIIKHIDNNWVWIKSPRSPEQSYPNVQALMEFGDKSVPMITDAIKKEDNLLRMRLLSYSLYKIMKQEELLPYLDKLLAEEGITQTVRKRLELSRVVAAGWSNPH